MMRIALFAIKNRYVGRLKNRRLILICLFLLCNNAKAQKTIAFNPTALTNDQVLRLDQRFLKTRVLMLERLSKFELDLKSYLKRQYNLKCALEESGRDCLSSIDLEKMLKMNLNHPVTISQLIEGINIHALMLTGSLGSSFYVSEMLAKPPSSFKNSSFQTPGVSMDDVKRSFFEPLRLNVLTSLRILNSRLADDGNVIFEKAVEILNIKTDFNGNTLNEYVEKLSQAIGYRWEMANYSEFSFYAHHSIGFDIESGDFHRAIEKLDLMETILREYDKVIGNINRGVLFSNAEMNREVYLRQISEVLDRVVSQGEILRSAERVYGATNINKNAPRVSTDYARSSLQSPVVNAFEKLGGLLMLASVFVDDGTDFTSACPSIFENGILSFLYDTKKDRQMMAKLPFFFRTNTRVDKMTETDCNPPTVLDKQLNRINENNAFFKIVWESILDILPKKS